MSVRKLWRLWVLVLIAVVLAWLTLQEPPSSRDVQTIGATRQSVRMPAVAPPPVPVDPAPALLALSKSTLWGPLVQRPASGAGGDAEVPLPKWDLTGYFENAGTKFVIVSFEQQARPSQQLKVADKLPDGSRIEQIEPDRVRVQAPRVSPSDEGASSPKSGWLPITPGLSMPAPRRRR